MNKITDKLDFTKIKNVCSAKDVKTKINHRLGETFRKGTYEKGLLSKIYKELLKLNSKKPNLIKKLSRDPNRHLTGEDVQMSFHPVERCSTSYAIR